MKRRTAVLILCLLGISWLVSAQESERRTALVIGNADYESAPLKNPVNDARDMAETLRELGFSVMIRINADQQEMWNTIRDFGNELVKGGVGLFYYAGHGMQVGGRNYLIPVQADIRGEDEIQFKAIDAGVVLSKMERAGNRTNIVILDACRDNPFKRSFRAESRGLAVVEAPTGSLVVYATAPGSVAAEGRGRNGVFTGALLTHIKTPGIEVEAMLKKVRTDVLTATGGEQTPWSSSSLTGSFYFSGKSGLMPSETIEKLPSSLFTEKTYGSVELEVKASGTFYLDGIQQWHIPAKGRARVTDLEIGSHSVEMHYDNGERETKMVNVLKDKTVKMAFDYFEQIRAEPIRIYRNTIYFNNSKYPIDSFNEYPNFIGDLEKLPYLSEEIIGKIEEFKRTNTPRLKRAKVGVTMGFIGVGIMALTLVPELGWYGEFGDAYMTGFGIVTFIGGPCVSLAGLIIYFVSAISMEQPTKIIEMYNDAYAK